MLLWAFWRGIWNSRLFEGMGHQGVVHVDVVYRGGPSVGLSLIAIGLALQMV